MTFVTGDNNFSVANFIVDPTPGKGTHTTIAAAITAAASGNTIMIKPGTYTENLTIAKDLIFFSLDGPSRDTANDNTIINGNMTISGNNRSVEINNVLLKAPAGAVITSTGTGCQIVINSCTLNAGTGTGIVLSGSGLTTNVYLDTCYGVVGAGGNLFTNNAAVVWLNGTQVIDVNPAAIASTVVSGNLYINNATIDHKIDVSGNFSFVGGIGSIFGTLVVPPSAGFQNFSFSGVTIIANFANCFFNSFNQICMSIGATCFVDMANCSFNSSIIGDVITGTGTLQYNNLTFYSTALTLAAGLTKFNYNATTAPVKNGGTGAITLTGVLTGNGTSAITANAVTQHAIVIGAASNAVSSVLLTNGQLAIGSTGVDPTAAALTAGTGISISNGAGSIIINSAGAGLTWSVIVADQTAVVGNGYICNKGGLLTLTLPASAAVGDMISVTGINTALGWKIAQNANQQIFFGTSSTTVGIGGSIASINTRDSIFILCVVAGASTVYNVVDSVGNMTIV